jgi:hypothetical protein
MPTQQVEHFVQDPLWLLKFAAAALLLVLPLTIGAHFARARRSTIALTFPMAFAALLTSHYAASAFLNGWGLVTAIGAALITLGVGIRYLLGTRILAALVVASATVALLLVGLYFAVEVDPLARIP